MPTITGSIICPNADLLPVAQTDANVIIMGLLPDTQNCRWRMRRESRKRFSPPQQVRHAPAVMHVGIAN